MASFCHFTKVKKNPKYTFCREFNWGQTEIFMKTWYIADVLL